MNVDFCTQCKRPAVLEAGRGSTAHPVVFSCGRPLCTAAMLLVARAQHGPMGEYLDPPGRVLGIANLDNTCYMNVIFQALARVRIDTPGAVAGEAQPEFSVAQATYRIVSYLLNPEIQQNSAIEFIGLRSGIEIENTKEEQLLQQQQQQHTELLAAETTIKRALWVESEAPRPPVISGQMPLYLDTGDLPPQRLEYYVVNEHDQSSGSQKDTTEFLIKLLSTFATSLPSVHPWVSLFKSTQLKTLISSGPDGLKMSAREEQAMGPIRVYLRETVDNLLDYLEMLDVEITPGFGYKDSEMAAAPFDFEYSQRLQHILQERRTEDVLLTQALVKKLRENPRLQLTPDEIIRLRVMADLATEKLGLYNYSLDWSSEKLKADEVNTLVSILLNRRFTSKQWESLEQNTAEVYTQGVRWTSLTVAPKILLIELSRSVFSVTRMTAADEDLGEAGLANFMVWYPELLTLPKTLYATSESSPTYKLFAVIRRQALGSGGHFCMHTVDKTGAWWEIDDSTVRSASLGDALFVPACLLWYAQVA